MKWLLENGRRTPYIYLLHKLQNKTNKNFTKLKQKLIKISGDSLYRTIAQWAIRLGGRREASASNAKSRLNSCCQSSFFYSRRPVNWAPRAVSKAFPVLTKN